MKHATSIYDVELLSAILQYRFYLKKWNIQEDTVNLVMASILSWSWSSEWEIKLINTVLVLLNMVILDMVIIII